MALASATVGSVHDGPAVVGEAEAAPVAPSATDVAKVDDPASCARAFPKRGGTALPSATQGSTVSLASWGQSLVAYVAHEDDRSIHAIDIAAGKEVGVTPLGGTPSSILVLPDGRIAVTLRDANRLEVFEPGERRSDPLSRRCSLAVHSEPVGLAVSADGATLALTSGWGHKLVAFDVASMKARTEVDLPREPRAVVMTDDGERAFVAHVVDSKMSVVDLPTASSSSSSVRTIDLAVTKAGVAQMGCQGFALAKAVTSSTTAASGKSGDGAATGERPLPKGTAPPPSKPSTSKPQEPAGAAPAQPPAALPPSIDSRIFAPMVTVDPGERSEHTSGYGSPERGPTEKPMVSVIDSGAERTITRTAAGDLLASRDACLLPRAAAFHGPSSSLLVACLGSNSVLRLDARTVDPSRRELSRFPVAAGPTGIAVDQAGGRAVVFSQFASKLSVLSLDGKPAQVIDVPVVASRMPAGDVLRGRTIFHATHDARISGDGRACASCHPDGREDAITWQTPDGPRQTLMLAGRIGASTAPFGWHGDKKTVQEHVTETLVRLRGRGMASVPERADFDALISYVSSLRSPSPTEVASSRTDLVRRGREIFNDADAACTTCHPGGGTTGKSFSVTGEQLLFDTPSLKGVAGTAPYFHDGRYKTIDALLAAPDHSMGKTLQLTRKDRVALSAYLETL
ncbi:MAG: c-type cytochrome [Polyangiaceae bacterium]|nr:c-type cytochrome [Polyangiaceae bacterium]